MYIYLIVYLIPSITRAPSNIRALSKGVAK